MASTPREEDLPVIHERVLKMLKLIHEICLKHHIDYFMQAGTLLGAVRDHKFIKWDDDGDIMMYREEFEKFRSIIDRELDNTEYFLKYTDRVPKVVCRDNEEIRVDIFIIDYLPNNRLLSKYKVFMLKMYQGMAKEDADMSQYSLKGKILVGVTVAIGKLFSDKKKLAMYEKMSVFGNSKDAKRCFFSNDLYRFMNYEFERDYYRDIELMAYEDLMLYAPKRWHEYLVANYGENYMIPQKDNFYVSLNGEELNNLVSGKEN